MQVVICRVAVTAVATTLNPTCLISFQTLCKISPINLSLIISQIP